jgi:hypothetical protein
MKIIVKAICVILLLFNGLGAFYGGIMLIADPSGAKLKMPLSLLEHSPFSNFLIPGIVLVIVNGIFSFVTLMGLYLKKGYAYWLVMAQGILLSGWILVQLILLRMFYAPLHATFLIIGLGLIGCGFYLKNKQRNTDLHK